MQYVAFLQESDPPPAVLAALSQTHAFLAEAADKDGLSATEALGAVLGVEGRSYVDGFSVFVYRAECLSDIVHLPNEQKELAFLICSPCTQKEKNHSM